MSVAALFPRFDHPAIEERYASWQAQMLLRAGNATLHFYDPAEPARDVVSGIGDEFVLAITDPLLLVSSALPYRFAAILSRHDVDAVVPVTNETTNPAQRRAPDPPYLTLRELQLMTARWEEQNREPETVTWDAADPAAFLCRTALLAATTAPLRHALDGKRVAISQSDYVHRWSSMRGQVRTDLLERVGAEAKTILEIGCGEAPLGAALKERQRCRVVGIELDPEAAALARKRIDDVYEGDVREIVSLIWEKFDAIVGGDVVEHLDEPWSFLADLRRLAAKGGTLILSLPNLANASVVGDLLDGRFDYVYMGITCVGHLRFFTRRSIEEMLRIAGWSDVTIEPQRLAVTPHGQKLIDNLGASGLAFSADDLLATGYYVTARNR